MKTFAVTIAVALFILATFASVPSANAASQMKCVYLVGGQTLTVTYYNPSQSTCPRVFTGNQGKPTSSDSQYGFSTTGSSGKYGVNDHEVAVKWILQDSIGIGNGFTDNNKNWWHIGIGNNVDGTTCTTAPEIWGEVQGSSASSPTEIPLMCTHYASSSQLSIVYDSGLNPPEFAYFVNGTEKASVSFQGEGSTVSPGNTEMIEYAGTPACPPSTTHYTTYTTAFEYANSAANKGKLPTFSDPSSSTISPYGSFPSCWTDGYTTPAPYTIWFAHS